MGDWVETTDVGSFLADRTSELRRRIRHYALRAGLLGHVDADELVEEVFQDLVVSAMESERSFDPVRPRMAWLQGIIVNLLKQKCDTLHQYCARFQMVTCDESQDGAVFDRVAKQSHASPEAEIAAEQLLSLVSPGD